VHENNEINRLDKLGNTSRRRRATDVVGGPCTLLYTSWVARQCGQH